MPYGRGLYGGERYGGGYGPGSTKQIHILPPLTMKGAAYVHAVGTRAVAMPPVAILGKALMTANAVVTLSLGGNMKLRLSPAGYFRADVPPTSPADLGLAVAYIERVSPIMPTPTLSTEGRPV